jgi:hypothetical protein
MPTSDWINLFGGTGTWAVAILAVWGGAIRSWLFKPTLRVDLLDPGGELIAQNEQRVENGQLRQRTVQTRYYHVKLSKSGRFRFPAAREAQVLITHVELPGPDGLPQMAYSVPLPLIWQYAALHPTSRTIGPDAIADLLYVREDDQSLRLTPMVFPNNFPGHHTTAARLWVTLQARSIEANSRSLRLEIAWDGQWDAGEAEMRRHLRVAVAPT